MISPDVGRGNSQAQKTLYQAYTVRARSANSNPLKPLCRQEAPNPIPKTRAQMKRFTERFKQKLGVGSSDRDWTPTSNGRNQTMEKDIRAFAQQLKAFQKQVKDVSTAVDGGLSTFKTVLLAPLPRAHEETAAGVVPIDRELHPIGLNVNPDFLVTANNEVQQRLQQEVLSPLDQWLAEYRKTKENNKKLEAIRLDLDNKRRTTLALQEKYQKLKANDHKDAGAALIKVQGEEDKLNRLGQRYAEKEAEMFNAFLRLIRDSAVLRDFIAAALAILQRCFTTAYTAFAMAPVPAAPMLPSPALVPLLTYTPADINVAASMRISAAELGASMTGPMPLNSRISGMSSRVATNSSGGVGPADPAATGSPTMTIPEGAAASFASDTAPPAFNAAGSATFAHPSSSAITPYTKAPASPNVGAVARSQTLAPGTSYSPSKPVAVTGEKPGPMAVAAIANPVTPAALPPPQALPKEKEKEPQLALPAPASWRSGAPQPSPPSDNGSSDGGDSNPFSGPPAPDKEASESEDPSNPFNHTSEDGRKPIPA